MNINIKSDAAVNLKRVLAIFTLAIIAFGTTATFAQKVEKEPKSKSEMITEQIEKNSKVQIDQESQYYNGLGFGAVFAMTNAAEGNAVVRYIRLKNGNLLRLRGNVSTHGLGIGVDTDTQGPLRLSADNRFLYAVNPGSDNISVFQVFGVFLRLIQVIDAGDQPLSLTLNNNFLYSMDGSVAGNGIRGFRIMPNGTLQTLPDSFRMLSSPIAVPGEVKFSPDGRTILVTQKTTNTLFPGTENAIDAFTIDSNGYASEKPIRNASFGLRPFSLDFRSDGKLIVVESFNASPNLSAASSYSVNTANGTITPISGSVGNAQTDICWVTISNDGQYAYTANFGSGTISSYRIASDGSLTLVQGIAASTGAMSQPVDLVFSRDGRFIYQLLRGTGAVASFRVVGDGTLIPLGLTTGGLPVANGASGLAAF